jgi:hypothetical protein
MATRGRKWQRGGYTPRREPIWDPLLELLPEDIDDFMWMGEVELTDGTRIQLYKHYWTRRYLPVDLGGRVWGAIDDDRYEEAPDPEWVIRFVFRFGETRGDIVRRNEWVDDERIGRARSATERGIPPEHAEYVIRHAGICSREGEEDASDLDQRFVFLGPDPDGRSLEVIAVVSEDDSLMIIHAMSLRERWERFYREGLRWQK